MRTRTTVARVAALIVINGICSAATTTIGPADSLQDAIDAASDGDTILLEPGAYMGDLHFDGIDLTVRSENPQMPAMLSGSGLRIEGGHVAMETLTLEFQSAEVLDMSVAALDGCEATSQWFIDDADVILNATAFSGLTLGSNGAAIDATDCQLSDAQIDADAIVLDGVTAMNVEMSARLLTMTDVTWSASFIAVTSIFASESLTMADCAFINSANPGQSALIGTGFNAIVSMTNCHFENNDLADGVLINITNLAAADATIASCDFLANDCGACVAGQGATIEDCRFEDNTGAAISLAEGLIDRAQVRGNGAAVRIGVGDVRRSRITGNANAGVEASIGAQGPITIANCLIADNTTGWVGGGVRLFPVSTGAVMTIVNSTIVGNTAQSATTAGAGGVFAQFGTLHVRNCILTGNQGGGADATDQLFINASAVPITLDLADCLIDGADSVPPPSEGGWTGVDLIDADPRFVDPGSDDYRLLPASPAIDAGDSLAATGIPTDIDGRSRILGAAVDIGAFERCPADVNFDDDVTFDDLNILLDAWAAADPLADLDGSGVVDFTDLNMLLDAWADSCIAIIDEGGAQ
ncbi:right-handed parallel beta-helix repeat-containing protein [Pyruvatibacter sp.]|uniref:right-handed parallel beta-helix repeat-containing protein n=1 Tax=Pyruvatibacter sp. TaxID=1981328 RepID=UPI0032EFADEC